MSVATPAPDDRPDPDPDPDPGAVAVAATAPASQPPRGRPRVGLIGFYGLGNFGDDLMAWLCARHLADHGLAATLLSLGAGDRDSLAGDNLPPVPGLATTGDPSRFVADSDVLVWGGGGLLISWQGTPLWRWHGATVAATTRAVELACARGTPRLAISVGGNGRAEAHLEPPYKNRFLDGAHRVTVRNPEDLATLAALGLPGACYPDLVWQVGRLRPAPAPAGRGGLRIGLDLYPANLRHRRALYLVAILQAAALARRDVTFVCLNSTHRSQGESTALGRFLRGPNVERYQFRRIEADLEVLAGLDLVLSGRLHVPVCCLAAGVPALALFPEAKTRTFFERIGCPGAISGHAQMPGLARQLVRPGGLEALIRSCRFPDVAALVAGSHGHLDVLRTSVEALGG